MWSVQSAPTYPAMVEFRCTNGIQAAYQLDSQEEETVITEYFQRQRSLDELLHWFTRHLVFAYPPQAIAFFNAWRRFDVACELPARIIRDEDVSA